MFNPYDLVVFILLGMFFVGLATFATGVVILVRNASDKELKTMTLQTHRLVEKGIAEDVAGLVGNASNLLSSMDRLVQTRRGAGVMLAVFGAVLMAGSCGLAIYVYRMSL